MWNLILMIDDPQHQLMYSMDHVLLLIPLYKVVDTIMNYKRLIKLCIELVVEDGRVKSIFLRVRKHLMRDI